MMDDGLPSIAERDLRAEDEWCRVALNAQSMASRLSEELAGLARDHETQGKLLQQAVAELARLRSAPVAVEVPELADSDLPNGGHYDIGGEDRVFRRGYALAVSRIRPIPSDRVLKEGEREELEILRTFFNEWRTPIGHMLEDWSRSCTDVSAKIDALRSQRAAEGGKG